MIALTVILALLSSYVPMFSLLGTFLCGVPLAALTVRTNLKASVCAAAGTFLLCTIVMGNVFSAAALIMMSVIPGIAAGCCIKKGKPFYVALLSVCLAVCLGWLFEIYVLEKIVTGGGVAQLINEMMSRMREMLTAAMKNLPSLPSGENALGKDQTEIINSALSMLEQTLRLYFPAMVIISAAITGYFQLRIIYAVLKRTKITNKSAPLFSQLCAPRSLCNVFLLLAAVYAIGGTKSPAGAVCANIMLTLGFMIGVCGLSFIDSRLAATVKKPYLRVLIYIAALMFGGALSGIMAIALVLVGIFDSRDNRRNLHQGGDSQGKGE